jgi:alkaline phosphatase D
MTNGGRASLSHNPHIKFYNGQRGYVTATVTPDTWTSEYKVVDKVSEPGGSLSTRATFVVESGSPGAQED